MRGATTAPINSGAGDCEMKYWEIIAERLTSHGWSYGYCTVVNQRGERIYVVSANRHDGKRYVFHSDEILTAFLELERFSLQKKVDFC